jgi:hypothetical protein
MEFSTIGCRIMLGTTMSSVSAAISFRRRSCGPKRMTRCRDIVDGRQFLAQRHEVIGAAHQPAEEDRQLDDQHARRVGLRANQRGNRRSVLNRKCGLI